MINTNLEDPENRKWDWETTALNDCNTRERSAIKILKAALKSFFLINLKILILATMQ